MFALCHGRAREDFRQVRMSVPPLHLITTFWYPCPEKPTPAPWLCRLALPDDETLPWAQPAGLQLWSSVDLGTQLPSLHIIICNYILHNISMYILKSNSLGVETELSGQSIWFCMQEALIWTPALHGPPSITSDYLHWFPAQSPWAAGCSLQRKQNKILKFPERSLKL